MKPSGIEWIGDIPDDWKVRRLKAISKLQTGNTPSTNNKNNYAETGFPWLKPDDLCGTIKESQAKVFLSPAGKLETRILPANSILLCCIGSIGKIGFVSTECASNQQITALIIKHGFWRYFLYVLRIAEEELMSLSVGNVVFILNSERLGSLKIPFPPLKTQRKIADYLDEECREIDATIAKQKESIEKLKAYKQSLISETVTKGLDKSAPLKPSGIDYLGDIPSHWEIKKLKYVAKLDPTISEFLRDNDIVSFAPMECLGEQTLSPYETEYGKVKGKYTYFANEDIIMAKVTPCFENGNIAIAKNLKNNVGFGSSELFVFRAKNISNSFLMYSLYSEPFKSLAKSTMYGTGGLKRVSPNFILNYKIPLPPLKTQESIADYLDSKCSQIDKYITEKQNIIQKLDAYKKSLIFECVTGKQKI